MNQTLHIPRLIRFMQRQWTEHGRNYLVSLLVVAGAQAGIFMFTILTKNFSAFTVMAGFQAVIYFMGLFIMGCILGSAIFADLSSKPKGISYLLIPASALEKLLSSIFYAVILFFVCYTAIFYAIDSIFVNIAKSMYSEATTIMKINGVLTDANRISVINMFSSKDNSVPYPYFFYFYFALQAAFLLGSVYFEKFNFIKTACALLLFGFVFALYNIKIVSNISGDGGFNSDSFDWNVYASGHRTVIHLATWVVKAIFYFMEYGFTLVFLVTAYFRLKEKEV